MLISEIYAAIPNDAELSEADAFARLAAIELLARNERLPVFSLGLEAPEFARRYPEAAENGLDLKASQYRKWRSTILDLQFRYTPGDVDGDPWASLRRAHRMLSGATTNCLFAALSTKLGADVHPRDLNDEKLLSALVEAGGSYRASIRTDAKALDELFDYDAAKASGLLPKKRLAPLPPTNSNLSPMSPELQKFLRKVPTKPFARALRYLNNLGVRSGMLNGSTDTVADLVDRLFDLPDPETIGMPRMTRRSIMLYRTQVLRASGLPDPRLSPAQQGWDALRCAARNASFELRAFGYLATPAIRSGFSPSDLAPDVAARILEGIEPGPAFSGFRRACEEFDALFGSVPANLLPAKPLGIRRPPPSPPRPGKVCIDPVKSC